MKLLSQQVLGRRAKRGTSEGRGGGVGPNWVSEVGGGLLVEGFEMVLLFDREPAEAREVGVMCSGCWSGTPQSSECVGVTVGGRGKTGQNGSAARRRVCDLRFHLRGRREMIGDEQCLKERKAALEMRGEVVWEMVSTVRWRGL